ncbi:putative zinc metalloprotease [Clostridiales bacterium]|nr:putative zinc metalloprotease [Clostridiales bacterium]
MSVLISIIVFSVIIIVHELGHFFAAKRAGIFVEEFSVGMGPAIVSGKIGETIYSLRAFPLGGYCKMQGEDEEISDIYDPERSFNNKSVLQRIGVIFAGPAMNFVLAFLLIFILLGTSGFILPQIKSIEQGSPAYTAGMMAGDRILKVNGKRILIYQDFSPALKLRSADTPVNIVVERDREKLEFFITPEFSEEYGKYMMGFSFDGRYGLFSNKIEGFERSTIIETIKADIGTMVYFVKSVVKGFVSIITFQVKSEDVSGPIGIIGAIGDSYEAGMEYGFVSAAMNLVSLSALLSTNLGVLNLFPIPAMDGGRLAFLIAEGVRRKPVNPETEGKIHFAGFVLLMGFMVVVICTAIAI